MTLLSAGDHRVAQAIVDAAYCNPFLAERAMVRQPDPRRFRAGSSGSPTDPRLRSPQPFQNGWFVGANQKSKALPTGFWHALMAYPIPP